jgi:hypothetical protein
MTQGANEVSARGEIKGKGRMAAFLVTGRT